MHRPYKIINGVSYPNLYTGANQTKTVTATNLDNPYDFYNDEGIRLGEDNIKSFVGKSICEEHDVTASVGEISDAWKDSDGKMRITARVYVDSKKGQDLYERINRREMKGLSVGYKVKMNDDGTVKDKECYEISVCKEPFFPGAEVSVCATGKEKYKANKPVGEFVFTIMASETNSSAAPPMDSSNKDASELARAHDELLRKAEADATRLKQLEEQNRKYELAEQDRLARYAESRKPHLKEVLDLTEQQLKEQNGPTAELPAEYRQSLESVFLNPLGEQAAAVVTASAMTWKKARDEKLVMETRMKELESKHNQFVSDQQKAIAHVQASAERVSSLGSAIETTKTVEVTASRPLNMSNLFRVAHPNERERDLLRENYGSAPSQTSLSVNASTPVAIELPTHNQLKYVGNSLRFQPGGGPGMFDFCLKNADKFAAAPTRGIKVVTTRSDE